jgi:Cu(I)/Ag(I) efflux system membrane protein CusA/SilA
MVLVTVPFALVGGYWFVFLLGYHMSIATAVGFIALAGVATEFGVIMLVYLDNAVKDRLALNKLKTKKDLIDTIMEGAVMRVRPKAMTVAVIIAGLVPIMLGQEAGSEVMQHIAAPMVGGMITAPLLSLFVLPVVYYLWKSNELLKPNS